MQAWLGHANIATIRIIAGRGRRTMARSVSSLENGFWCAHLFRTSRNSLTRLRSAKPSVRLNTSFQVPT